jgi:hypothetical protein
MSQAAPPLDDDVDIDGRPMPEHLAELWDALPGGWQVLLDAPPGDDKYRQHTGNLVKMLFKLPDWSCDNVVSLAPFCAGLGCLTTSAATAIREEWGWLEQDRVAKATAEAQPPPDGIECVSLPPIEIAKIPPRRWAYGRFLLFGSAAVIGAVDGGGKGAIAVVMALAMITGKPLLGERVWRTGPVVIVTFEDDEIEWQRRFAAACIHYEIDFQTAMANVRFIRKPGDHVSFAMLLDGGVVFPDSDGIIARLKLIKPALLIIDPFNRAHDMDDGNSNVMIAKVAGEIARIAQEANCAVLVLHHLRKGASGTVDDLMGATSLRATFRSCRILARMPPEMAEKMNIIDPWRHIRLAGSKENYAPPPERGTWYRLAGVSLGNATEQYPDGDSVAVATMWQPRPLFAGMDNATLAAVFGALRQGQWGPAKQSRHTPWAGNVLIETGGRSEREATRIIAAWIESGVLVKEKYYHTPSRHEVDKLTLDDGKAAAILDSQGAADAPAE